MTDSLNAGSKIRQMIADNIDKHGRALQGVMQTNPLSVPWTYSVGNHPAFPELVLFGIEGRAALFLLNRLSERHVDAITAALEGPMEITLTEPANPDWSLRVRLAPVHPRWVRAFCHQARYWHGTDDIPFVHVIAADKNGRLPGEPGADAQFTRATPDLTGNGLAFAHAWGPLGEEDAGFAALLGDPDAIVLMPVCDDLPEQDPVWEGAYEAVEAVDLGDGTARLVLPPVTTAIAGPHDILDVRPAGPDDPTVDSDLPVLVATGIRERNETVRHDLLMQRMEESDFDRIETALARLTDTTPGVGLIWHLGGIVLEGPPAAGKAMESAFRRWVRDGKLRIGDPPGIRWADGTPR